MKPAIYVNGRITDPAQAVVPVLDRGVLYGDSVYEVLLWHAGAPVQLDDHLDRLDRSAEALYLKIPFDRDALVDAMVQTVRAAGVTDEDDAYLRLVVTRGVGPIELSIARAENATLIVIVKPADRPNAEAFDRGVSAMFVDRLRVSKKALDPSAKTGNYMNNVLALHEAKLAGADDALLLNANGHVTEATTSNVYVVREGILFTPELAAGLLEGTTRRRLLALCAELEIEARECVLTPEEVRAADEVFLSSSVRGMMPVVRVDEVPISAGPGPVTRRLHAAFEAAAAEDAAAWHARRTSTT